MRRNSRRRRSGAASLEFALVAPAMFVVVLSSFEFMRVQMIQNMADVATYEATRKIIVPGAKRAEAFAEVDKYIGFLGTREPSVIVTAYRDGVPQSEINDFTSRVEVVVQIPVRSNTLILSRFFGDRTITARTALAFESYSGFYDGSAN